MPNADDIRWFKQNFSSQIMPALAGTPFDVDMIAALACQETGEVWPILRKKNLPLDRILALCVGDTIDFRPPNKGRQAFPRNREALVAEPNGRAMFEIARKALEDMAVFISSYQVAAGNPNKFCHGFGMFQRDIQFFKDDPDYFLQRRYETFDNTLAHCLAELKRGLKKLHLEDRTRLTDMEFCAVAIAYNTGHFNPDKGLKQGFQDESGKFYGECIFDFVQLSRSIGGAAAAPLAPGRYAVVARGGLKLRGGPGTNFNAARTLAAGTELNVVETANLDPAWAHVDLEGDGMLDGFVFASFLAPAGGAAGHEHAPEPN
jgi:hypothetical protein